MHITCIHAHTYAGEAIHTYDTYMHTHKHIHMHMDVKLLNLKHVNILSHMHTYMHTYTTYKGMQVDLTAVWHALTYVFIHTHAYIMTTCTVKMLISVALTYVYKHTYTCTKLSMQTNIHTYIHTCIHTCRFLWAYTCRAGAETC